MGRGPCRAPGRQHPGPIPPVRRGRAGLSSGPPERGPLLAKQPATPGIPSGSGRHPRRLGGDRRLVGGARSQEAPPAGPRASISGSPRSSPGSRSIAGPSAATASRSPSRSGSPNPPRPWKKRPSSAGRSRSEQALEDRSFEGQGRARRGSGLSGPPAQRDETRGEGERGHGARAGAVREPWIPNPRATRPVAIGSSRWKTCSQCPATANRRLVRTDAGGPPGGRSTARPGSSAEFPFLPEFRASLAWSLHRPGGHVHELRPRGRGRGQRAAVRRDVRGTAPRSSRRRSLPPLGRHRDEGLGGMLEGSDRLDEAKDHFRRAIAILPEAPRMRARIARKLVRSPTHRTSPRTGDRQRPVRHRSMIDPRPSPGRPVRGPACGVVLGDRPGSSGRRGFLVFARRCPDENSENRGGDGAHLRGTGHVERGRGTAEGRAGGHDDRES